jgi:16S rRNA (adenine1518-N6/adenine1519-N6)-dimethyltransferase
MMKLNNIRAKKSLGQNFLIDHEALSDIAGSIEISLKHIIEVGPGYGALTDYIVQQSPLSIDLVELDIDMITILDERKKEEWTNIPLTIHHQDILTFTPRHENYSVIANIPYYITSPILFHFLYSLPHPPEEMTIMMQKEVWEKILEWRAKKPHHSFISLAMEQACNDIEIVRYVDRTSFDPAPKVDSIVLKFTAKNERNSEEEQQLIQLWKVAFAHPRKTLLSNIKWSTYNLEQIRKILTELGYDERVRAEAIKKEDWIRFL